MSTNVPKANQTKTIENITQNLKQKTQTLTQNLEKTNITDPKKTQDPAQKENFQKIINEPKKEINEPTPQLSLTSANQKPKPPSNTKLQTQPTPKQQIPNHKNSNPQDKTTQKQSPSQSPQEPQLRNCINIKTWEEYALIANNPQITILKIEEIQNTFKITAQKNNLIYTFKGQIPKTENLLKNWLSQQLQIPKEKIYEGTITT